MVFWKKLFKSSSYSTEIRDEFRKLYGVALLMDSTRIHISDEESEAWILKRVGDELKPRYSLSDEDINALRRLLTADEIQRMRAVIAIVPRDDL
jgi:2-oxoglutarate dehydrogenase complex dehydrogenase (E1) component-like enzyme